MNELEFNELFNSLKDNHRLFVLEYVKDRNALQSYKTVYNCDDETARANGSRLLTNADIKACIDYKLAELTTELDISNKWKYSVLKSIADNCAEKSSDRINAVKTIAQIDDSIGDNGTTVNLNFKDNTEDLLNDYPEEVDRISQESSN